MAKGVYRFLRKHQAKGVHAFIDSQNLNLAIQSLGWKLDWSKFRQFLYEKYDVDQATLFVGYVEDQDDMYNKMCAHGFNVIFKKTTTNKKQQSASPANVKGNVDVDLTLEVMNQFANFDKAIIVSNDGDFHSLIEYLRLERKLSCVMVPSPKYSRLLEDFNDYLVRLYELKDELVYMGSIRTGDKQRAGLAKNVKPVSTKQAKV